MRNLEIIKTLFKDAPDLKIRIHKKMFKNIYILYLESVSSGDRVNNFILAPLKLYGNNSNNLSEVLTGPNFNLIDINEVEKFLCSGFSIVLYGSKIYAIETKAELDRGISEAKAEPAIYGPKDSLVENYQKNIGLIKIRLRSSHLKIIPKTLGRYSKTVTGVLYIDNIANQDLVDEVSSKLDSINTEAIISSGEVKQFLLNENKNVFPSMKLSERPDTIVRALLDGKIVIMVDTSPFAIILPSVLADFINPTIDNYTNSINVNYLKILRIISFILTIITPALYIGITNFNPESIPGQFLMNISTQRFGVPFPSIVEALIMLFICELLRESDLRFPNSYGSAISLLGGLIIGESAVASGIVSPIMIIIIAVTFVTSLMFNEVEINGAVRAWRYIFLIFSAFLGLYGLAIAFIFMLINLCSYQNFNLPYMFPLAPFDLSYIKETLIKVKRKNQNTRSRYLTDNIRKQD